MIIERVFRMVGVSGKVVQTLRVINYTDSCKLQRQAEDSGRLVETVAAGKKSERNREKDAYATKVALEFIATIDILQAGTGWKDISAELFLL